MLERVPRRFLGLPIHPMAVHFPLVLWLCLPALDALALLRAPEAVWWQLALAATATGVVIGALAVMTGLLDYIHLSETGSNDTRLAARHGVRTGMVWMVMTVKLLLMLLLVPSPAFVLSCLVADVLACALLLQGALLGTRITYGRYGR